IDIFAGRIDRLRPTLRLLPVVLEGAPALILCVVDLPVRMQAPQRIAADRAQGNDLLAGLQRERIIDLDRRNLRVVRHIARTPVVDLRKPLRFASFGSRHVLPPAVSGKTSRKICSCRRNPAQAASTSRSTTGKTARSDAVPAPRV